ncbi:chitinase [Streptomyces sp. NPDC059176]|uniref:chitinase n=1 Tax=Streptomyces sp. NPDC059176 TaxID=3346758 RepID=UPI00368B70F2
MRSFLRPMVGLICLSALVATGCSPAIGSSSNAASSVPSAKPSATALSTAYQPYVSATDSSATDTAGSPSVYNLAFVISDGTSCTPKWYGSEAVDDPAVTARIAALTKDGASVRVSFGGASGEELASLCGSPSTLAAAYAKALDTAGSAQADFDVEGSQLADPASVALRSEAIALLQRERAGLEVSFTLPVMPSGLDAHGRALLESANDHGVRVSTVNIMTMNYGESYAGDMGDYAITSAEATHDQLAELFGLSSQGAWQGMALTSMIGVNDVPGETFTLSDAAQVRSFAEARGLSWVSMWSTFRDRQCADDDPSGGDAATNCSGVQQGPGAFGRALAG